MDLFILNEQENILLSHAVQNSSRREREQPNLHNLESGHKKHRVRIFATENIHRISLTPLQMLRPPLFALFDRPLLPIRGRVIRLDFR